MFYSHEILTSRKYGVATVWLVATLGAKSNTKKLSRKAILDVDVRKACETIIEPEAPMALRLQSNLLYGVSRVYSQQCTYVLTDAQTAQNNMRALMKIVRNNTIDIEAGKTRPEQLMLQDDPAFLLDAPLPALDFDLDFDGPRSSQRSSQSMMSVRHRSGSNASSHVSSRYDINISSSIHSSQYQLPLHDPLAGSSAQKLFDGGRDMFGDEEVILEDDGLFEFNEDGDFRDIPASKARLPTTPRQMGSDSAASRRVRKEHDDAAIMAGRILDILDTEGDFDAVMGDDEFQYLLPDADAFPVMTGGLGFADRPQEPINPHDHVHALSDPEVQVEEASSAESAHAQPLRVRKLRLPRKLAVDGLTALRSADLIAWNQGYLEHMAADKLVKNHRKETVQAKTNAAYFIFGTGLNCVGEGIGSLRKKSPLAIFSGDALLARITGVDISSLNTKSKTKKSTKRVHSRSPSAVEQASTPKRLRPDSELGRGANLQSDPFNDHPIMLDDESASMELGRDAASALLDHPSSALMPWNVSASLRIGSSSIQAGGGRGLSLGLGSRDSIANRRLASASPLVGRGSMAAGRMDNASQLEDELNFDMNDDFSIHYGRDGPSSSINQIRGRSSTAGFGGVGSQIIHDEEFEIFGPAANVDTQTAGASQWVQDALDRESNNFLDFVKNSIAEKQADEIADNEVERGEADGEVAFEELFDPAKNSRIVAAQAFYHILTLATRGAVRVWQGEGLEADGNWGGHMDDKEESSWGPRMLPFGEIRIGIIDVV